MLEDAVDIRTVKTGFLSGLTRLRGMNHTGTYIIRKGHRCAVPLAMRFKYVHGLSVQLEVRGA
jgi:hypothetical protein